MRDRGQSELVGFVFIFGLILLTISLVTATGFVGVQNARDHQRTTNAERAFTVLADNVDDVTRHGAPSRATEIKLADAKLSAEETTTVTISGERVSNADDNFTHTYAVHPIVYDAGTETEIAYSNGAVVRRDGRSAIMIREPDIVFTDDAVVVPIVRTYPVGNGETGGSTTVLVQARHADTEILRTDEAEYEITLEVTSSRADAWERYFASDPATDCSRDGDTVSCDVTTDRVSVTVERIAVSFS